MVADPDRTPEPVRRRLGRRGLLAAGGAVGLGALGWQLAPPSLTERIELRLGIEPEVFVPDAPEGMVRVERMTSRAMGDLDLFTAVPAGHGEGAGLPVVVVLHGSSASAAQLQGFGLGRFVTAAVDAGAPPFVLVGHRRRARGLGPERDADPQRMLRDELPALARAAGLRRRPAGAVGLVARGYGALRFVAEEPDWAAALALFSPALGPGDPVLGDLDALADIPWGLWCGEWDPFRDGAVALADAAPVAPDPWVGGDGGHTRAYWNAHTLAMLDRLAREL